jgi:hypothetical protein
LVYFLARFGLLCLGLALADSVESPSELVRGGFELFLDGSNARPRLPHLGPQSAPVFIFGLASSLDSVQARIEPVETPLGGPDLIHRLAHPVLHSEEKVLGEIERFHQVGHLEPHPGQLPLALDVAARSLLELGESLGVGLVVA